MLTVETRPPNDNFDRRIPIFPAWTNLSTIEPSQTNAWGWNKNGTPEPGELPHRGETARVSVWWSFQAPVEGHVVVSLNANRAGGGVLAAYTGDSVSNLVSVLNRTNLATMCDFVATTNVEYFFAVEAPPGGYKTNNLELDFKFNPNLGAPFFLMDLDLDGVVVGEMDDFGEGCRTFSDFKVEATSLDGTVNYQWQFAASTNGPWSDLVGKTNANLVLEDVTSANQGWYRAAASNRTTTVFSQAAYLEVVVGPRILLQPVDISTNACTSAQLKVEAESCSPITFQWYQNDQPVTAANAVGANTGVLRLNALGPWNEGTYHAVISNAHASVVSSKATLTLTNTPTITRQPVDVVCSACQDATFSVSGWADCPLFYQWFFNDTNLVGTSSNLTLTAVQPVNAGSYFAVVSTPYGQATSRVAQLSVRIDPKISVQPVGTNANICDWVVLAVTTEQEPDCSWLAYQWQFAGANLPNQTNRTLGFQADSTSAGDYWVIVSNRWTNVTSKVATVTVDARPLIVKQPPPTLRSKVGDPFVVELTVWTCEVLDYFWQFKPRDATNFTDLVPGPRYEVATNGWLTVKNSQISDSGSYRVVVSNSVTGVTSSDAVVRVVAPPLNDNFADGFSLGSTAPAFGAGHNEYATAEEREPPHAGLSATNSVWWSWTNPAPALVTVDLAGSDIDTLLGIYVGSSVSSLTNLAQNDEGWPDHTSLISLMAGAGKVLHFAIDGKDRGPGSTQGTSQGTNLMIAVTASPILTNPVITVQPLSQAARGGETITFTNKCYGSPDMAIQWYGKGNPLPSDTRIVELTNYLSVLTLTNVTRGDEGVYHAVLSNAFGTASTRFATLTFASVVRGMVTDATKTTPDGAAIGIPGVRVSVGNVSTNTDEDGNYELAGVSVGALRADFMANKTRVHLNEPIQFWNRSTLTAALLVATKTNYYDYVDDQFEVGQGQTVEKRFSMSPIFQGLRFVLNWTNEPVDLDLALHLPEELPLPSHWIDYLPANKGSTSQPPFAVRDVDVGQGWGPETITIHRFYPGTYSVYGLKYPGQGGLTLSQSSSQVAAYLGHDVVTGLYTQLRPLASVGVPPVASTNEWWHVCDVDGLTTNITWINQIIERPAGAGGENGPALASLPRTTGRRGQVMGNPPTGVDFAWDFGDGTPLSPEVEPVHSYGEPGWKTVSLRVTERVGNPPKSAFTNKIDYIYVENLPPTIAIIHPPPDTIFRAGDDITLESEADGIDDPMKEVEYYLQDGARRTLLGTVHEPPYTFLFPNHDYLDTTYTFLAQARDLHGATAWSAPVTVRVADLRGDILIIRNFPSIEIETMAAYLDDLGEVIPDQDTDGSIYYRRPVVNVLDQEGLRFELVQDFRAIIWNDQGAIDNGLTVNDVAVLQQAYEKGIPLYLIGEQLGVSRERLIDDTLTSYYQWTDLLGFEAAGTIAGPLEIHGIQNTDEDGIFYGCYNDGSDPSTIISYAASVERAELTSEQMEVIAETPIPTAATNSPILLRYPRFDEWDFGQTRRLVQDFRVVGDRTPAPPEDEASIEDRRKLFINGVCWLLRLFQAQEVNVTLNCLTPSQGYYVGSVGEPLVFVTRVSQNGADTAGGVVVTNRLSFRLMPESAEVVPVVANAPTNTYRVAVGTNIVVARFGELRRGQVYELRTTVVPRFRGWVTNEYSAVRGLYEWPRCSQVAFIEGPACVGPLHLTIYLNPYHDLRLRVTGGSGCLLQLQSSTDLHDWQPQANLEPSDDFYETTLGNPSVTMRYYRVVTLDRRRPCMPIPTSTTPAGGFGPTRPQDLVAPSRLSKPLPSSNSWWSSPLSRSSLACFSPPSREPKKRPEPLRVSTTTSNWLSPGPCIPTRTTSVSLGISRASRLNKPATRTTLGASAT